MLLHYVIRIVEKNPVQNDFTGQTVLDFDLKKPNSDEKFSYPVFGKKCEHLERPLDLPEIVKGYNSCKKKYECQTCNSVYTEISDFWPHPIFQRVKKEFHPQVEKISLLHGFAICNLKRHKKRFGDPLANATIKQLIVKLFTYDESQKENQFFHLLQLDQRFMNDPSIQFQSLCLLDNVNIVIPVRHKNCKHIGAYELTSLITYQKENFLELKPPELKLRESNKYLKCLSQGCQSSFPLETQSKLFEILVLDFEYMEKIKQGYPGNQIYLAKKEQNGYKLYDYISNSENCNQDNFIRNYWLENGMEGNQYVSKSSFQKQVLEKMVALMNQELHKNVKEKINRYKYGVYEIHLKDQSKSKQMVEYPARCYNCPIESVQQQGQITIRNMDIRTFIAYILQRQSRAKAQNDNTEKVRCPLCDKEFTKPAATIAFANDLIYYDSQLYFRMQQQITEIKNDPEHLMRYAGDQYLLSDLKNKWKYTLSNYQEQIQSLNQQTELIVFSKKKCPILSIFLKDPIINFKCKNLIRISFDAFYQRFSQNNYKMNPAIKLCKCEGQGCEPVSEIEGQLYYDHLFVEAYSKREVHQECEYGFSYNINTKQVIELRQQDNAINTKIIPPSANKTQDQDQE